MANFETTLQETTVNITTAELKEQCRIDFTDDDTLLELYLKSAIQYAPNELCAEVYKTTKVGYFYNNECLELLEGQVQTVTEVKIDDTVLVEGTDYKIIKSYYPQIKLLNISSYTDAEITIECGYAVDVDGTLTLKEDIKNAIMSHVAYMYENRGDTESRDGTNIGLSLEAKTIYQANKNIIF